MSKNVYYEGKLIPVKDWDYDKKRPKSKKETKMPKVLNVDVVENIEKEPIEVSVEIPQEVQPVTEE